MASRPLSPVARERLRDGCLGWGVTVALVVAVIASTWHPSDAAGWLFAAVLLAIGSAGLLVVGVRGRQAAARFNRWDDAFADALTHELDQLQRHGRSTAYALGPDAVQVTSTRVLEAERLFDEQTTPYARPTQVPLVGSTTRANVLGDAVFAVLQTGGRDGLVDTVRVVAPSTAASVGWLDAVVAGTAVQLGGGRTHAGATVLGWRPALVQTFRPGDVSYLSDRLRAAVVHPGERQPPVQVWGAWAGRNAILPAQVRLGTEAPLHVMPLGFPALLDRAVGIASTKAGQALDAAALGPGVTFR